MIYIIKMILRDYLEIFISQRLSPEAAELRQLVASQEVQYNLCDLELDKIKAAETLIAEQKQELLAVAGDELDQDRFRSLQQQRRSLLLQEREWEYRKVFHCKIRDICLILSQNLKANSANEEITALIQSLLDQLIELYFSNKNKYGCVAVSKLDIKIDETRDLVQLKKYSLKRKICKFKIVAAERAIEVIFATIKFMLLEQHANAEAKRELISLEAEQEAYALLSQTYTYSLQQILSRLDTDQPKSADFLIKVDQIIEFVEQQNFVIQRSLLELYRESQKPINPLNTLEHQQALLYKVRSTAKTFIFNVGLDVLLSELDVSMGIEPRIGGLHKQMLDAKKDLQQQIFDQTTQIEVLLRKVKKCQDAIDQISGENNARDSLVHHLSQLKSELLINVLILGRLYLQFSAGEQSAHEKLERFEVLFEYYNKHHQDAYIYGSETVLTINMDLNLALRFLFIEHPLLSELLHVSISEFKVPTKILYAFPVLAAEDDGWSDDELSGMPYPPPPIPIDSNTPAVENNDALAEEEFSLQNTYPMDASRLLPNPAGL